MSLFGRNKNKGKPPPGESPAQLVEDAFLNLRIHVRLQEQGVLPTEELRMKLLITSLTSVLFG